MIKSELIVSIESENSTSKRNLDQWVLNVSIIIYKAGNRNINLYSDTPRCIKSRNYRIEYDIIDIYIYLKIKWNRNGTR